MKINYNLRPDHSFGKQTTRYLRYFLCLAMLGLLPLASWTQGLDLEDGTSNNSSQNGGFLWVGANSPSGLYLSFDNNEIQARNGSSASTLYLNYYGGNLDLLGISNTLGDLQVDGDGLYYDNSLDRVGIGTTSPTTTFDVRGNTDLVGDVDVVNGRLRIEQNFQFFNIDVRANGQVAFEANGVQGDNTFVIDDDTGFVGIGLDDPDEQLHILGNLRCEGGLYIGSVERLIDGGANTIEINASFDPNASNVWDMGDGTTYWDDIYADNFFNQSDMRMKTAVDNLPYGLEEILSIQPIRYLNVNDPQNEYKLGVSAQELLTLIPEAVKTHDLNIDQDGNQSIVELDYYAVDYTRLIPVLISAVHELKAAVDSKDKQLEEMKADYEARISRLEALIND